MIKKRHPEILREKEAEREREKEERRKRRIGHTFYSGVNSVRSESLVSIL